MSYRIQAWLRRLCVGMVALAVAAALWFAWSRVAASPYDYIPHWMIPLWMEACSVYVVGLWLWTPSDYPKTYLCLGFITAENTSALALLCLLTVNHVAGTPAMVGAVSPLAPSLSVLACGHALAATFAWRRRMEHLETIAPSGEPIGHSDLGEIGAHAGNALTGTAVYRFFTTTRDLIYAGKSRNFPTRFKDHRREKPWFRDVHHMTVVWYDDEASALTAETQAIKTEGPRENVTHNPGRKPQ